MMFQDTLMSLYYIAEDHYPWLSYVYGTRAVIRKEPIIPTLDLRIGTRHFRMHAVTRQHNPPSTNLISLPFPPNPNPNPIATTHQPNTTSTIPTTSTHKRKEIEAL